MEKFKDMFLYDNVSKDQHDFLHNVLDVGMNFFETDKKTFNYLSHNEIVSYISCFNPRNKTLSRKEMIEFLEYFVKHSIPQCKKNYLAFPDTGNSVATIAADIIKSCTNQNLIGSDRSAPVAVLMEIQLINWFRELIGYSYKNIECIQGLIDVGGLWTTGGNMSNCIAIMTALRKRYPSISESGLNSISKKPVIIVSKAISHYSIINAVQYLGLGKDSIIWADTDETYHTSVESVESIIENIPNNYDPFLLVAVAGNCRTSGVDDLISLNKIARKHNMWFHVDACHGGCLLFSQNQKKRLAGIEDADSVSLDPHKSLFVTYSSSYVIFKNSNDLGLYCRYPEKFNDGLCLDLGLITPFFGSRGFESLKLWLLFNELGFNGIGELVEKRFRIANKICEAISSLEDFILLNDDYIYRFSFVFVPKKISERISNNYLKIKSINDSNKLLSDIIYKRGNFVLDCFNLVDINNKIGLGKNVTYTVMGISVGHIAYSDLVVDSLLSELRESINVFYKTYDNIDLRKIDYSSPADWSSYA